MVWVKGGVGVIHTSSLTFLACKKKEVIVGKILWGSGLHSRILNKGEGGAKNCILMVGPKRNWGLFWIASEMGLKSELLWLTFPPHCLP